MVDPYRVFIAGELFDLKDLVGNAFFGEALARLSQGRFHAVLPQDMELRGLPPQAIRDADIRELWGCDLAVFNFDGTELDSGTVVEFMLAKAADIPAVLLRTDLRAAGDQGDDGHDPWNLMVSFFPRTRVVRCPSLRRYRQDIDAHGDWTATQRAEAAAERVAQPVIEALDGLLAEVPQLPAELNDAVYQWLARMPGLAGDPIACQTELADLRRRKIARNLL